MRAPDKSIKGGRPADYSGNWAEKLLEVFAPIIKQFFAILFICVAAFLLVKVNLLRDIVSVISSNGEMSIALPGGAKISFGKKQEALKDTSTAIQDAQGRVQTSDAASGMMDALTSIAGAPQSPQ